MTWLSMVIALVLLISAATGWRAGIVRRAVHLVGVVAAVFAAGRWGAAAGDALADAAGMPERLAGPVGWIAVFAVVIAVSWLVAWGVMKLVRSTPLGWLDHGGGAFFGLLTATLVLSVLLLISVRLQPDDDLRSRIDAEPLPKAVYHAAPAFWNLVAGDDGRLGDLWTDVTATARDAVGDAAGELGAEAVEGRAADLAEDLQKAYEEAAEKTEKAVEDLER